MACLERALQSSVQNQSRSIVLVEQLPIMLTSTGQTRLPSARCHENTWRSGKRGGETLM